MKKLVITALTVLACGGAYALPVGNPADASLLCDGLFWEGNCCADSCCDPCGCWWDGINFRFGFYGDYVFNRKLEVGDDDNDTTGARIEHASIFTNAAYFALNFCNRADLFATLGASHYDIDTNVSAFIPVFDGPRLHIQTRSHFSWSVGGRITLWECGCTALGIEGQYFQFTPRIERITYAQLISVYPTDLRTRYREWQVGLGISHRINMFVPYVAVKYSRAKLTFDDNTALEINEVDQIVPGSRGLQEQRHWGFAAGVTLVDCNKMSVTVEGRWFDEQALHVNAQIRF